MSSFASNGIGLRDRWRPLTRYVTLMARPWVGFGSGWFEGIELGGFVAFGDEGGGLGGPLPFADAAGDL